MPDCASVTNFSSFSHLTFTLSNRNQPALMPLRWRQCQNPELDLKGASTAELAKVSHVASLLHLPLLGDLGRPPIPPHFSVGDLGDHFLK